MNSLELNDQLLTQYLQTKISDFTGPAISKKFSGGQSNPTYLLTAKSGDYVLRRKPRGILLKSAHAVDREFRVMQALEKTEVPVPRMLHLCEDESVIGSIFFVMECVRGEIYWDATLPDFDAAQRKTMYQAMGKVLSNLHRVNIGDIGLSDFGRPGNYFSRQISRWTQQYEATETETIEAMNKVIEWLPANLPEDDGRVSLVHGDFRLDNMMFNPDQLTVTALLDWELSTLGHPFADLAYQCMQLRMDPGEHLPGLNGIDRSKLGIPGEQEYVDQYCQYSGIEKIDNWPFYLIFSFFRMAAILQGVKKRAIDGNASSATALGYATLVKPLAEKALLIIQQEL
ncbi:MAG: aminoglycoside phosphotransferase (APT) family kinase protein [Gammaproteobacteria bacterium]|jgi:aminoglycoside phosphotransferase (APT) family kinase protein